MAIIRWMDPMREMATLQERMNQIFSDFFTRGRGHEEGTSPGLGLWAPAVDIYETADDVVVSAELPGVDKDRIHLEYKDGILTLRGERKVEKEVKEENYHRMERVYGTFQRSLPIPSSVDEERIKANFRDGILEVHMPKKEAAKPRQIKVAA